MNMNAFDRLTESKKADVMEQVIRIYGANQFINDGEMTSVWDLLKGFECAITDGGDLYPPDETFVLEFFFDEIWTANAQKADFDAAYKALDNARKYVAQYRNNIAYEFISDLGKILDMDGVAFDEGGNILFVG